MNYRVKFGWTPIGGDKQSFFTGGMTLEEAKMCVAEFLRQADEQTPEGFNQMSFDELTEWALENNVNIGDTELRKIYDNVLRLVVVSIDSAIEVLHVFDRATGRVVETAEL